LEKQKAPLANTVDEPYHTPMAVVRHEHYTDITRVHEINERAFHQPDEANLVDALRANRKLVASLVVESERTIVGHILFSPARIEGSNIKLAALAPMAVMPEYQHQGIGSLLVRAGLDKCRSLGYAAVIVLGHPDYYTRFGFKPASAFGLMPPWNKIPDEAFMAVELRAGARDRLRGVARFADEFDEPV
jgi:putative acetyltransferase